MDKNSGLKIKVYANKDGRLLDDWIEWYSGDIARDQAIEKFKKKHKNVEIEKVNRK